jgi:hypothetical protein
MIFFANVYHSRRYYDEVEWKEASSYHTIEAENEEDARDKIMKYYEDEKSDPYYIYYRVTEIDFAIHIK